MSSDLHSQHFAHTLGKPFSVRQGYERQHPKPVHLRGNNRRVEEGKGELSHLAYCGLVHEPHFPLPPPQRGIVGVKSLLEVLFVLLQTLQALLQVLKTSSSSFSSSS